MLTRKSKFVISALSCLVFVIAAGASMVIPWHGLSQGQRNTAILNVAMDQIGDFTGMQCKVWVQDVVNEASLGEVYPPQNINDTTWASSSNVKRMLKPFPIEWVIPGDIIQMQLKQVDGTTTPHTAIVVRKNRLAMEWVDCNWHHKSAPETVFRHTVKYTDFYKAVQNYNYNVYEIK
jgi:hypothetical protein